MSLQLFKVELVTIKFLEAKRKLFQIYIVFIEVIYAMFSLYIFVMSSVYVFTKFDMYS